MMDSGYFQKIGQMLKKSMRDYEKLSMVTYPFFFHKLTAHA